VGNWEVRQIRLTGVEMLRESIMEKEGFLNECTGLGDREKRECNFPSSLNKRM
jgi:hypothetical protein